MTNEKLERLCARTPSEVIRQNNSRISLVVCSNVLESMSKLLYKEAQFVGRSVKEEPCTNEFTGTGSYGSALSYFRCLNGDFLEVGHTLEPRQVWISVGPIRIISEEEIGRILEGLEQ